MLTRRGRVGLGWRRAFRGDRRGGTGVAFALMMSCFMCFVGAAVDLKRATDIRVIWQDAADLAALAGATRYTDSTQAANAKQVATTYFGAAVPSMVTLSYITAESAPTVTTATGTLSTGQSSYQVTVAATVTISTTFMELWETTMTVGVTATAANPIVTPVFSAVSFSSGNPGNPIILDDDTVYAYPVPMSNGLPQYGTLPASTQLYELGRNNPLFTVPAQTFPTMTATQPFAFALRNVTGGVSPYGLDGRCLIPLAPASNAYGVSTNLFEIYPIVVEAPVTPANSVPSPASYNWFYSAYLALGEAPTQSTNYSYPFAFTIRVSPLACLALPLLGAPTATTTYPTTTNCSFQAEIDNAGTATASNPPQTGVCFTPTATPGVAYAAMSCEQLGTNTFAVWWNDMGGDTPHLLGVVGDDRKNYSAVFFTVSCASASAISQVVLIN